MSQTLYHLINRAITSANGQFCEMLLLYVGNKGRVVAVDGSICKLKRKAGCSRIFFNDIFQFPFIFNVAAECGFQIPRYFLSYNQTNLQKISIQYEAPIFCNSLRSISLIDKANSALSDYIAIVEGTKGSNIFVYLIADESLTIDHLGDAITLNKDVLRNCFLLKKRLSLGILSIVLKKTSYGILLYYFSPSINWHQIPEKFRKSMFEILLKNLLSK